jgi:EF-hand domain pair
MSKSSSTVAPSKETDMRKHVLVLSTTAAIFACGVIGSDAQAPTAPASDHEMGYGMPITRPFPHVQIAEEQESDEHHGMVGMMGRGFGHRGGGHGMVAMRIIFSLMDADGDGKLTLQEWQAAHERIFKAMDTDHDGTVTFEEMQAFMRGRGGQ